MHALWALSGFSTLTFELVWMHEAALRTGNTVVASVVVTAVFFCAAALGNLWGARLASGNNTALLCYARCEIAAALSALMLLAACRWLWHHDGFLPSGRTAQWLVMVVLVGPPSFFSGVAFPSLAEAFVEDAGHRTTTGAPFYACNLLGAATGVAAGGVWLPLCLGIKGAFIVAAVVQLTGGVLAWWISLTCMAQRNRGPKPAVNPPEDGARQAGGWLLLAASGALSLAAQSLLLVWARQVLEGSVYATCGVLAAFIGGLGFGALAASTLRRRGCRVAGLVACFAGAGALLLFVLPTPGLWLTTLEIAPTADTPSGLLMHALGWCALVLAPLAFCLGGVFPLAWEVAGAASVSEARFMGRALAVNKLGAALGSAGTLFVLLPVAGLSRATIVLGWGYLLVALVVSPQAWRRRIMLVLAPAAWPMFRDMPPPGITAGLRVIATASGAYGPVSVVEDARSDSRQILLNSRQRLSGTRGALSSQVHQSWAPLLLCRAPDQVLTIGMAAGISAAAALDFPVKKLEAVELVPEVVAAARQHFQEWNHALFTDPRAHVIIGDGRSFLANSDGGYDAIICDLFFPGEAGTAHLYSRDFARIARRKLSHDGIFCLWLPCYQLTAQTAGIVVRGFLDVFPHAIAIRANFDPLQPVLGLVGCAEPIPISRGHFASKLADPAIGALAARSPFLRSPDQALLMFAGDLRAADPGFESFSPTTDDAPLFAFLGPREPRGKERLFGFPFLDWIGKRFPAPNLPSCKTGDTTPGEILAIARAGNYWMAAAAAGLALPGDTRPDSVRKKQVADLVANAQALAPSLTSPLAPETKP